MSESKGAANKEPICPVSMHAPQISSPWRGVGGGAALVEWGVAGGYGYVYTYDNPANFHNLHPAP